jgi:hypothetical protein
MPEVPMTPFDSLSRLDRIALIARAMGVEVDFLEGGQYWIAHKDRHAPFNNFYDPYTNKAQVFELMEKFKLSVGYVEGLWGCWDNDGPLRLHTEEEDSPSITICDWVARMQWEKEAK